jgi:hypothetical protein
MEEQMEQNLKPEAPEKRTTEARQEMSEKVQEQTVKLAKSLSLAKEEQQTRIVWCGGTDFSHDVTICLVPMCYELLKGNQLSKEELVLTKVKIHSSRLRKCSKYFETCLTERWKNPSAAAGSSLEFVLEVHADVVCYTDCFSRMYKPPFFKDFKDVSYSLGLLKAASQIQFLELMESVSLFLSSKQWSETEEMVIRMYATGQDFRAQDLVVRLGMDESREECHKQLCDVVEQCICTALAYDGNFRSNRAFFKEMLPGSLPGRVQGTVSGSVQGPALFGSSSVFGYPSNVPSNAPRNGLGNGWSNVPTSLHSDCMRDVVTIVSREAKSMVAKIAKECEGKAYLSVPRFAEKVLTICWILETLLAAKVAEEFVQCFVHLHALPKILAAIDSIPNFPIAGFGANLGAGDFNVKPGEAKSAAVELARLVLAMYQEVAAGNLLLKTPERVALLENWHSLFGKLLMPATNCNFDQATKNLFMTLPLKQQMLLVKLRKDTSYESYISTNSLAKLVKRQWPAMDEKVVASSTPSSS